MEFEISSPQVLAALAPTADAPTRPGDRIPDRAMRPYSAAPWLSAPSRALDSR